MSAVRRLSGAAAAVLAMAIALPAHAGEDMVWITIERATAHRALAGFGAAGRPDALSIVDAGRPEALRLGAADTDIVVARIAEGDVADLSAILHRELRRCGGFIFHESREGADKEAARANDPSAQQVPAPPIDYTIDNGPVVQALMAPLQEANVRSTITSLGAFFTRYHNCPTGQQSATWIRDRWQLYAQNRPDVTVEFYTHSGYATMQPSVILTIAGTTLPSEVVVLGGHQDSTTGNNNCSSSRSPGEDDDASGIASLSEVLRVALSTGYRPLRTVKFMAYAAEEVGLRGSNQIAATFQSGGANVVGVMQLDMTNYKGSSGDIYIYTDFTNAVQNTFVGNLVDSYLPGLVRGTSACGYGCSDHASWTSRGYPASFPFEAVFGQHDPFIHTSQDTIAQSGGNANHALKFARLAAAYMAEVAKGGFTNQPPVASAGPDLVAQPLFTTLDGRGSSDPDNGPFVLTYSWTQVSGPPVTILNAQTAVARFRAAHRRRNYVFRLTVSDGFATATDDVTVRPRPLNRPEAVRAAASGR